MKHEYIIKRSRRKTVSLTIKHDCTVEVHAPLTLSKRQIDEFVSAHSDWIEKNIIKAQQINEKRKEFTLDYGSKVRFFGKRIAITQAQVRKAKLTDESILMPPELSSEQIKLNLIALYKETAKEYIGKRLPFYSQLIGVSPSKMTISSAKTNWGSCTADRVHFSWHLIMADKEIIDYVIIHELVHIIHHNHSEAFWSEVKKHCPQYKTLRARLKEYSEILVNENWC